jgi:hypothetical protein
MRADNRRPKPCFTLCSSSSCIDGFHQSKRFDAAGFEVLPKRWDRRTNFLRGSAAIAAWLVTLNATPQPS